MGLIDVCKSIGNSHGIEVGQRLPTPMSYSDSFGVEKSQTWKLIDDAYKGLESVPKDGDYQAFLNTYAVLPWIYIAAWIISTSIASRPLKVFYQSRTGARKDASDSDVANLLRTPNRFDDFPEMIELMLLNLELCGNHYWERFMPIGDIPSAIYSMEPQCMLIKSDPKYKIGGYTYDLKESQLGMGTVNFTTDQIVHFKYTNPSSQFYGQGVIKSLQTTLITELNRESYNKAFFENEARPDVVLSHSADMAKGIKPLTSVDRDTLARKWKESFATPKNARRPVVLENGMNIDLLESANPEMAYREMEKSHRERVLGAMGVPPALTGLFEFANYANTREQIRIFWTCTLPPKARGIASQIQRGILRPVDEELRCEFDMEDIPALDEAPKEKAERLNSQFDRGLINRDEYREQIGKPNMLKDKGQTYFMLGGYVTVEDVIAADTFDDGEGGGLLDPESDESTPQDGEV